MSESTERVHVYLRSATLTENARLSERHGAPFLVLSNPAPVRSKLRVVEASGRERGFEVLHVVEVAEADRVVGVAGRWIDQVTERTVGSEHLAPDPDAVAAAQSGDFGAASSASGFGVIGAGESGMWGAAEISGSYRREASGSAAAGREDSAPRPVASVASAESSVSAASQPIETVVDSEDPGAEADEATEAAAAPATEDEDGSAEGGSRGKKRKGRSRG